MRIELLGVGEAFDPALANSSALVEQGGFTLLIDCGHSAVPPLWRARSDPDAIDAIYFTHHHADHVLGLPAAVNRWHYTGRRKELLLVSTPAGLKQLRELILLTEVGPPYPIRYAVAAETPRIGPFGVRLARTEHPAPNHAIRLEADGRRFAWSGDGRPTPPSLALYAEADLLMHECYVPHAAPEMAFHCDLPTVRRVVGPARIGLYHIQAGLRPALQAAAADDPRLFVPEPGAILAV